MSDIEPGRRGRRRRQRFPVTTRDTVGSAEAHTAVVGGGNVGAAVAERLREGGDDALFVTTDGCEGTDVPVLELDGDAPSALGAVDLQVRRAVVATESDSANLLAAQHCRSVLGADRVVVRLNDPDYRDPFEGASLVPVCATTLLATGLVDALDR